MPEGSGTPASWSPPASLDRLRTVQLAPPSDAVRGATVGALRGAAARLREMRSVAELLSAAAVELRDVIGADFTALLRIEGDEATLQTLCSSEEGVIVGRPAERRPISLGRFPADTAIVRRRSAALVGAEALAVGSGGRLPRPPRETSCAAGPVVAGGRVIGLAYAGWAAPSPPPDEHDVETVWAFCETLGAILESVWLHERLHQQLEHVRPLLMAVGAVLGEVSVSAISLAPARAETLPAELRADTLTVRGGGGIDALGLTRRELEVLGLMARGASNARIASELTIAQATVKSHVSAILKKLRVDNRTGAVLRYTEAGT